jgi:DNA modification methylase
MEFKMTNPAEPSRRFPLSIEYLPIESLKPDPLNARQHSDRQIAQIARSIETFGHNVPLLIDRTNKVLAGHGRLLACRKLGWQEVPVIRLEHLTEAQARAFAIADNRLTENSTWDDRLLGETLKELAAIDLGFSLEATGFAMGEIDLRIEGLSSPQENEPDPADELPEASDAAAVSRPGDLWLLGKHRILCGNALDKECYETLMQGERAHQVITDPPFNVKIDGHVSGLGSIKHREFVMGAGEMSELEFTDFLTRACRLLALNSHSGSLHYLFMDWRHAGELLAAGKQVYTEYKNLCIWVKSNGGMGSLYRSQHELIFVFKHGSTPHKNNIELGRHGRYRSNCWHYAGANSFARKNEEDDPLKMHPTCKPVVMLADAILDSSARGDIVLDSFLGSGTTLLAAERVGRICYGMEIDPLYTDTAIRRWHRQTGERAVHAVTGLTFDETAKETVHVG